MNIIGHQKQIDFLDRCVEKGAVSHAYLFSGPEAIGKKTVALDFSEKLTSSQPGGGKAETYFLEPEIVERGGVFKQQAVKVESILALQRFLALSGAGSRRVALVSDAHLMTVAAQNALLKTLEEPPEKAVAILVTSRPDQLLSTIRSRCQQVRFGLASDEALAGMLPAGREGREDIIFWSAGRPGVLKHFLEKDGLLEAKREIRKDFKKLFLSDITERFSRAEALSKNVPELVGRLDDWMLLLRRCLFGKKGDLPVSRERAFHLIKKIEGYKETLEHTNANARLVVENLFLEL